MKALAALAIFAVCVAAQADSLKATANSMLKKVSTAMVHKDFKALGAAMKSSVTPDFKYVDSGKTSNYDQMAGQMKEGLGMMKKIKHVHASVVSVSSHGKSGWTKTNHTIEATMMGPDNKAHALTMTGMSKDTWVKVGGKWKMSSMTWLTQSMKMDGKPFQPQAMQTTPSK